MHPHTGQYYIQYDVEIQYSPEDLFWRKHCRHAFADDNFVPMIGEDRTELVRNMETSLENIRKWIKHSGLKINERKTEICLFNKRDTNPVNVMIGEDLVTTSDSINILGVTFDSKMAWSQQIRNAITKSSRALNALSIIRRYFNTKEL